MNMRMSGKWLVACLLGLLLLSAGEAGFAAGSWNFDRQLPAVDAGVKVGLVASMYVDVGKQRYYLVDAQGGQLISFDKDGKFLAAFNAGGELKTPISMARTNKGVLWVVDRADNRLLQVNPRLQKVERFKVLYPDGGRVQLGKISIDDENRIFVLDQRAGAVLMLDDNLAVKRQYKGQGDFNGFVDYKVKGNVLWALDGQSAQVYLFAIDGDSSSVVKLEGLEFPVSLEVDSTGLLYILDRHAGTVAVFGKQGGLRFEFMGKGKRNGQLWFAEELIFDWDEKLCVVDEGNGRVEILTR